MPLIQCPDCGRSISPAALSCPQCGRPSDAAGQATAVADAPVVHASARTAWHPAIPLTAAGLASGLAPWFPVANNSGLFEWLPGRFELQWLAGAFFGAAIAVIKKPAIVLAFVYITITAAIYYLATTMYDVLSAPAQMRTTFWRDVFSYAATGAAGAFVVTWITGLFFDRRIRMQDLRLAAAIGALAATWFLFGKIVGGGLVVDTIYTLSWAVWQVAVGLFALTALDRGSVVGHTTETFEARLVASLHGPVARLLGVIGTILSIVSVLRLLSGVDAQ